MNVEAFLSGVFLFNSVPHLVKGIAGEKQMTPFSRKSSATVNIVWAFVNIILGTVFLGSEMSAGGGSGWWVFLAGGLFISLADAWLFSKTDAHFPWQKS